MPSLPHRRCARACWRVTGTAAARPARRWPLGVIAAALGLLLAGAVLEIVQKRHTAVRLRTAELQIVGLLADGGSKVVLLAGQAGAPQASGRLVWNAQRRQVLVLASNLPPAPHGKRYELWTIAGGAPVASGLFDVKSHGLVAVALEWLDVTPAARTFAITIEPAAGTDAPTGAMVLAGDVG